MSLLKAVKTIILATALMAVLPAMAMAHAGHSHGGSLAVTGASAGEAHAPGIKADAEKQTVVTAAEPASSDCASGSCCCQGMRTCSSSGHCGSAAFSQVGSLRVDWRSGVRLLPPRFAFAYPKIQFGLDRPPKA